MLTSLVVVDLHYILSDISLVRNGIKFLEKLWFLGNTKNISIEFQPSLLQNVKFFLIKIY